MCIPHSVMESQRHNNPLNPRCFCFTTAQKGWNQLLTHIIVEVAKALGGSFKLVTLAPKNCKGDDSTAQGNTKEWGHKQIKSYKSTRKAQTQAKYAKTHSAQPGCNAVRLRNIHNVTNYIQHQADNRVRNEVIISSIIPSVIVSQTASVIFIEYATSAGHHKNMYTHRNENPRSYR